MKNKKIYIKESSIEVLKDKKQLLPKFLFDAVKQHLTSLGNSECFPMDDVYSFDYTLVKSAYHNALNELREYKEYDSLNGEELLSELSKLITECKRQETPIRDILERINENAIHKLFAIPADILNLDCSLVDRIDNIKIRLEPESNDDIKHSFEDLDDINLSNKAIAKRRFINSLIQGAAMKFSRYEDLYADEINKVNADLLDLYRRITVINNYLLFTYKDELSDKHPKQGAHVNVKLGNGEKRTIITVKGLIFPLLFQETIRGIMELVASHGLPEDKKKAIYIVKKADFLLAEPWDMRFGMKLFDLIFGDIQDTNLIPYVFKTYIQLDTDDFNNAMKEILSNTNKGKSIQNAIVANAENDYGYQSFVNRLNIKNLNRSMIADSYFTASELDGFNLDDNGETEDIITEN